jgi:flagellin
LLRIYKLILIEDTDMTVINTNVAATVTAAAMKSNQRSMETTMERLATGLRVNSAQDDAAGLAIGTKMDSQIRGFGQAVRNANDGISMLQTADGAAEQITGLLQRMRELSVQGQNDTNSTSDLANLNEEFVALATEIERIADDTQFNGINLLNSNVSKTITIGADEADTISLTFGDFQLESGASSTKGVDKVSITQAQLRLLSTNAASAITFTDSAGLSVTIDQTKIGATAANNFSDATLANLATALNSAIDVASNGFSQVDALDTGDDSGISFTQEVAGSGSITSASTNTAGVVATRTVAKTTIGDAGAAASPMAANLTSFDASGSHVQTAGTILKLDNAIQGVNTARASFGSNISRLSFTVDNLNVAITNTSAAKSAVMDADYAAETTELARTQIIAQAATAMLSQANQQQQSVLALLK